MYVLNGTKVDYNVLALNLYNKFGNSSSIKVGNYDKAAISSNFNGGNLKMYNTNTKDNWAIKANSLSFSNVAIFDNIYLTVIFNPALPYIYVDPGLWTSHENKIK